jgi:two-component sensor histidine kinase
MKELVLVIIFLSFLVFKVDCQEVDSLFYAEQLLIEARGQIEIDTSLEQDLYQKALRFGERYNYTAFLAKARREYGDFLFKHAYYPRAFGSYFKSRQYYQMLEDEIHEADVTLKIAITQMHRGNTRKAIREYLDAINLSKKLNLDALQSQANEYLGFLYVQMKQYDEAEDKLKESIHIKEKLKDKKGMIQVCIMLSEMFHETGQLDSSIVFAKKILMYAQDPKFKDEKLNGLILLTQNFILLNKADEALIPLKQLEQYLQDETSDQRHKKKGDILLIYKVNTLLACYYILVNDKSLSETWLNNAYKISKDGNFLEPKIYFYRMTSEAYKLVNNFDKAFESQKQYLISLGEMTNAENLRNFANLDLLYDKNESDDKVKLLNAQNKLKEIQLIHEKENAKQLLWKNMLKDSLIHSQNNLAVALELTNKNQRSVLDKEISIKNMQSHKLKQATNLRSILLGFLFLSLLMGSIIFYLYKSQLKKNSVIQKQSEDLKYLMKEIHHRVKNNLQIVSSMLNLQVRFIKDPDAVNAVRDSKNRVMSMALLHQRLYQEEDFRTVNLADYIHLLVENLINTNAFNKDLIKFNIYVDKVFLNEDLLMPIGLILNELITNSIKYAFPNETSGNITLTVIKTTNSLNITIADDGIGMSAEQNNFNSSTSFGHKMISSFLQKLKGTMKIVSQGGTRVDILIPCEM